MARRPVDFRALKAQVSPELVLRLLGISHCYGVRGEVTTTCIDHACKTRRGRHATCNAEVMHCHRCRRTWDAVGMWAQISGLNQYDAAIELCARLGIQVPFVWYDASRWIHNIQRQTGNP